MAVKKTILSAKEKRDLEKGFDIGKIKEVKYIDRGVVNYVFYVETDKGKFVVKRLGREMSDYLREQKLYEFTMLDYLKKSNFPYKIPVFLKDKKGGYLSKIGKDNFEVCKWIEGYNLVKAELDNEKLRELARGVAIYHSFSMKFKGLPVNKKDYGWMMRKLEEIEKVEPKEDVDGFALKNVRFFKKVLFEILKVNDNIDVTLCHSDFSFYNVLFNNGKMIGIIDFENLRWDPKARDVAYVCNKLNESQTKLFIDEYRKYVRFSKKEEKLILPLILQINCGSFWWTYLGMKKYTDTRLEALKAIVEKTKTWYKLWKRN